MVNYPVVAGMALRFPVAFAARLRLPFGVLTYSRPVSLVNARAAFTAALMLRCYGLAL
ncbi:hypothetical protein PQ610_02145 [Tardisphaera miroshnichenkoae]